MGKGSSSYGILYLLVRYDIDMGDGVVGCLVLVGLPT